MGSPVVIAGGVVALAVAVGIGVFAARVGRGPGSLADVLSATIETRGIDAAVAQYRGLRGQGFPGLRESNAETNAVGYRLLGKGDRAGAIKVFQLNVETHAESANAHDSLAEAYLAAGDKTLAIENYRKAVAISPKQKSATAALQRLTGYKRPPLRPMVLFHVTAGSLGLLSGAAAMLLRKGSPRHGLAGSVFVVSMLGMSATGAYMAFVAPDGDVINILMGVLTFYLVATAWWTARRRNGGTSVVDWIALLVVSSVVGGFVVNGRRAEGVLALYLAFGGVALLAAVGDLRMIARGGIVGAPRIARHLWRISTALFIGVTSLFLGQPQVFPDAVRNSGVLAAPGLLVIALTLFWLIRVLFTKAYKGRTAPKPRPIVGHAPLPERPAQARASVGAP